MRLFRRIGDIIAANLNELVDRFEDPELMLGQAIREMESMIENATTSAARAIASDRLLARDLSEQKRQEVLWRTRAEEAVLHGDDHIARQAITRAHEHEAIGRALVDERSSSEQTAQVLRAQIDAMRAKLAEARRKLASLSAKRQLASTNRALRETTSQTTWRHNGFARFDQLHYKVDQAELEAEALAELYSHGIFGPESEIESGERARRVEVELVAIKERNTPTREPI
jgi:phage shock protein A